MISHTELVVFGLLDDGLAPEERKAMASQLLDYPRPAVFEPDKPIFPIELMIENPSFDSFVGSKSFGFSLKSYKRMVTG